MCSAQQTLRTWHTNQWRRSGHQPQDQEKDRIPPASHAQIDTALTPDWDGIPLKDPVRSADGHQKPGQQSGSNPPTSGTYEDVGTVRPRRRRANESPGELTSERETAVWMDAGVVITATKGRGGADDRAWERTPGSRSNAPAVLDRPLTNGGNECGWLVEPNQRRERESVLGEPTDERSGTSVTGLTIRGECDLAKEEEERPGRKIEWLRSGRRRPAAHTSRGDDSHKRDGRSNAKLKGMQSEPVVIMRDERGDNMQRSGRNSTGLAKSVESGRGGGVTHTLPDKQSGWNHEKGGGGGAGITTDRSKERTLTGPRVDDKEVRDKMQKGSKKVLHPEVGRIHTHTLRTQCTQLGPVTRSMSRAQRSGNCI